MTGGLEHGGEHSMSDERTTTKNLGVFFICAAGIVFVASFVACFLIQGGFPGAKVLRIFGFVAYLGGPLPVIPVVLGFVGLVLLGSSTQMK
jgi:hypothetical protein